MSGSNPSGPPPFTAARSGFALVTALVLMGMLVLLIVSLSTLVRVETQMASAQMASQQARENALVGLRMALGQLQRYAGPDELVTAPAEVGGNPSWGGWSLDGGVERAAARDGILY